MNAFGEDVIAAVIQHMNDDHVEDSLVIVRAFAAPDARNAIMVGLDGEGGEWSVDAADAERTVRVPWSKTISERAEIRREVVVLYRGACERLGIEPRSE